MLTTKSGSLLIPWGNWMWGRQRKQQRTKAGEEQQKKLKRTTQQQIKKLRKASEKINETTMTTWPNKLKKLQDKETWENCIWSPRSCLTSSSRQTSQWRTKTAPLSHQQLEELKRWVEHFREQLNRPTPRTPPDIQPAVTYNPVDCNTPSKTEIRSNYKTQEWKSGTTWWDTSGSHQSWHRDSFQHLAQRRYGRKNIPEEWKKGILFKLPKTGDLRDSNNYMYLIFLLLSLPDKVLNRILLERMKDALDSKLRDQHAGFWSNRSCADQIASPRTSITVYRGLFWRNSKISTLPMTWLSFRTTTVTCRSKQLALHQHQQERDSR